MWAQATRLVEEASRLLGTSFSDIVPPEAQRHLLIAQRELLLALAAVIDHHTQEQEPPSSRRADGDAHGAEQSARGGRRGSSSSSRRRVTNPGTYLAIILYTLPGFVFGSVIHELSHAAIALRLGDPNSAPRPTHDARPATQPRSIRMPRDAHRRRAWARPVPLDPLYLRSGRQRAQVAAAGPLAHLVVAAIFAVALRVELQGSGIDATGFDILAQFTLQGVILGVLLQGFLVNIALFESSTRCRCPGSTGTR